MLSLCRFGISDYPLTKSFSMPQYAAAQQIFLATVGDCSCPVAVALLSIFLTHAPVLSPVSAPMPVLVLVPVPRARACTDL